MVYCTLFDSNYSDKGLVMAESLLSTDKDARLYILCMDELCYDIFHKLGLENIVLLKLNDFVDEPLLKIKSERKWGEFCWTCTAKLIKYVINQFNEDTCTYVDSDLMFYSDPSVLHNEMKSAGCTVQVVPHRFPNTVKGRLLLKQSGSNCVQFNTFSSEPNSLKLLDKWIDQCLNECSIEKAGDQGYTNDWDKYSFINISQNGGAGMAPWNISRYLQNSSCTDAEIIDVYEKKKFKIVFYHFQGMKYFSRYQVQVSPILQEWRIDKKLVKRLYKQYAMLIEEAKERIQDISGYIPMTNIEADKPKRKSASSVLKQYKGHVIQMIWTKINNKLRSKLRGTESIIDVSK